MNDQSPRIVIVGGGTHTLGLQAKLALAGISAEVRDVLLVVDEGHDLAGLKESLQCCEIASVSLESPAGTRPAWQSCYGPPRRSRRF